MPDEKPEPIAQFFEYAHLPEKMQAVSKPFCELAKQVEATLPRNPERSVALRKLLEAKDAAVRALIFKALLFAVALEVLFAPAVALAQDAAPAGASGGLASFLTIGNIVLALGVLATAATFLFGAKAVIWQGRFALLIKHGFDVVEDLNADPALKGKLDKAAAGLKAINDMCIARGWRTLKPGEEQAALLGFKALNGQAEASAAVQTKAIIAAAEASGTAAAAAVVTPEDALRVLTAAVAPK